MHIFTGHTVPFQLSLDSIFALFQRQKKLLFAPCRFDWLPCLRRQRRQRQSQWPLMDFQLLLRRKCTFRNRMNDDCSVRPDEFPVGSVLPNAHWIDEKNKIFDTISYMYTRIKHTKRLRLPEDLNSSRKLRSRRRRLVSDFWWREMTTQHPFHSSIRSNEFINIIHLRFALQPFHAIAIADGISVSIALTTVIVSLQITIEIQRIVCENLIALCWFAALFCFSRRSTHPSANAPASVFLSRENCDKSWYSQ